jgi:hypothetical protein
MLRIHTEASPDGITLRLEGKRTAGSLGTIPGLGPIPTNDVSLDQGKQTSWVQNLSLGCHDGKGRS